MKRFVLLMAAGLMSGTLCAANSPFVGDWKLDESKSSLPDTMKVEHVSGATYSFNFAGTPEKIDVDGTDQPGVGGSTLAVTMRGPDATVVRKKDGRMLLTASWSLSKDGNTLRDEFTQIGPDGSRSRINYLYDRTAGDSGFAGTWHSTRLAPGSTVRFKIEPYEGDGLSITDGFQQLSTSVKFDGHDYPLSGNAPSGLTSTAKRIDENTIELTDAFKGRTVETEEIRLSPGGKTLTVTVHTPGGGEPNILVFERR